jgi:hypothetical protein
MEFFRKVVLHLVVFINYTTQRREGTGFLRITLGQGNLYTEEGDGTACAFVNQLWNMLLDQ